MENSNEVKNVNSEPSNDNLITCTVCGAQMAKSAKKCPSCGAKNKAKKKKKFIVFIAVILSIVLISGASSIIDTIKINTMDYAQGNARAMLIEHRANEAAANDKYSGEAYYFIGIVDTIDSHKMSVCVDGNLVVVSNMHSYGGEQLDCNLDTLKNTDDFYAKVKEGSTVIVKGVIDDIWNGNINMDAYYIELYEGEYEYTYLRTR